MVRADWRATVYEVLKSWTGGGNGNPLQYSCLENPMDREAWQVTVYGVSSIRHDWATKPSAVYFFVVQLLSCVGLFVTLWTAAHQVPLSFTISRSLLKLMPIESVMPSNHLIFCHPLCLLPSVFLSIRVFSSESALQIWGQILVI